MYQGFLRQQTYCAAIAKISRAVTLTGFSRKAQIQRIFAAFLMAGRAPPFSLWEKHPGGLDIFLVMLRPNQHIEDCFAQNHVPLEQACLLADF